jgi:FAD/FMN-containing dehydrogenase
MTAAFVNWAGTVRSQPSRWAQPASDAEVAAVVREAGARGGRVRAVGSAHSWSAIAAPDDVAVSLRELDRVLAVEGDEVTVEGGCRLRDLVEVLAQHGRALPIVGSVDAQTVAGLTATGTHGSSLVHGNLSSLLTRLRVVDGRGELRELDGDTLAGARVHLGALGVVTSLSLATVPLFGLEETSEVVPFDEAAASLVRWAREEEYVKVWWLPHNDACVRFVARRSDAPWTVTERQWRGEKALAEGLLPAVLRLGGWFPWLVPTINRVVQAVHLRPYREVGRYDRMLMVPGAPVHRETEMAIDLRFAGDALRWQRDWLRRTGATLDFIQELRFVPADVAWLSPAEGRDTCQIGAYAARSPATDAFFAAFREACAAWGGRPHWGKEHDADPARVRQWYPHLDRFVALAADCDPAGVLRNPALDTILGGPA